MSVTVTCPECDDRYEVSDAAAEQMIRCRRCQCPIEPRRGPASVGIQVKPILAPAGTSNRHEEDEPEWDLPRRHPTPKSRFPWVAVLVVIVGVLFFLLAFSVGFNFWFLAQPENRLRMEAAQQAQQVAIQQQRIEAEKAAEVALVAEKKAREIQVAAGKEADKLPWGTLEGRVVWKGELPEVVDLEPKIRAHPDKEHLLKGPKEQMLDPTWRIDPKTRGVANVAVYFKRPKNGMFPIHPDDRVRKNNVVMDSPFCSFEPYMVAVHSEWNDGKDRGETGQKFIIKNSSPIPHTPRVFGNPKVNAFDPAIPPGGDKQYSLKPQPLPLSVFCGSHTWMKAHVWAFDHPYYAITKADGSFTIPRVPADMEVQMMAWHEGQGWLFTKEGRTMKLNKGKNTLDFEMSAK